MNYVSYTDGSGLDRKPAEEIGNCWL